MELIAGGKSLAEEKIQAVNFQGDALSPLLHVIKRMPLCHKGNAQAGYKLNKLQEKINHLMYMDDIKQFAENEKEQETLTQTVRIYNDDIGMEFGI